MLRNVSEACVPHFSSINSTKQLSRAKKSCTSRRRARAASSVALALAMGTVLAELSPSAKAQSQSWTGATNQDWNTATNWSNNAFPNGVGTLGFATINLSTGNFPVITANSVFLPSDVTIGEG